MEVVFIMGKSDELQIDQEQLADAWRHTLPEVLSDGDKRGYAR